MKFISLIALLSMSLAQAQEAEPVVLEDGFKLSPKLEKPSNSEYEEKVLSDGKIFKKNSNDKFKVTKSLENSEKHDVYQLKLEKINGKIEKVESLVELDKNQIGKMKSTVKCGFHNHPNAKGGCQRYTQKFCKKLLDNKNKIKESNENEAMVFYKDLYKSEDAFDLKNDDLQKLSSMNDSSVKDIGEEPVSKELKEKIKPIYPMASMNFKKPKVKYDITYCKKLMDSESWASENARPNVRPKTNDGTSAQ